MTKKPTFLEAILKGLKLSTSKQARSEERVKDGINSAIRNFNDSIESKQEQMDLNLAKLGESAALPYENDSYSKALTQIFQENIRLDAQIKADKLAIESLERMRVRLQEEVEIEEEKTK